MTVHLHGQWEKANRIQNPRTRFLTPSIFRDQSNGLYASSNLFTYLHLRKHHTGIRLTYLMLVEVLTAPHCLRYLSIEGTIGLETWPNYFNAPGFELHHLNKSPPNLLRRNDDRDAAPIHVSPDIRVIMARV